VADTGDISFSRFDWHALTVPVDLPEVVDEISYERVIMNAAATWDYFPGHFDPEYAKRQGHPGIFVNTMHLAGFVDRIGTQWAGPYSRVVRRKIALAGSIYAGDTMIGRGKAVGKRCNESGSKPQYLVDLEIGVSNQRGELCCPAEVTIEVLEG
jgi:acyl dehydratase